MNPTGSNDGRNRKTVTLLLLRHGERKDEAYKRSMSIEERKRNALLPKEAMTMMEEEVMDSLDPVLTEKGYVQANEAWKNILYAISQKQHQSRNRSTVQQVTLVCSPLRRCIGTALMIVSALEEDSVDNHQNMIQFCGSTGSSRIDSDYMESDTDTDTIAIPTSTSSTSCSTRGRRKLVVPIHVMNGLATCAAAIFKYGGVTKTIQHFGYSYDTIPCAVCIRENDDIDDDPTTTTTTSTTPSSRFNTALQAMIHVAQQRLFHEMSQTETTLPLDSSSIASVQYFGIPNPPLSKNKNSNSSDVLLRASFPLSLEISSSQLRPIEVSRQEEEEHNNYNHNPLTRTVMEGATTTTSRFTTPERVRRSSSDALATMTTEHNNNNTPKPMTTRSQQQQQSRVHYNNNNDDDETFMGALNQAVYLALNSNNITNATATTTTSNDPPIHDDNNNDDDTMIDRYLVVTTHREGIRSLIDHCSRSTPNDRLNNKSNSRISTPYCCIGTFTATMMTTTTKAESIPEIVYHVQNVSTYQNFTL